MKNPAMKNPAVSATKAAAAGMALALFLGGCSTTSEDPETAAVPAPSDDFDLANPTDPLAAAATTGVLEDPRVPAIKVESRDDLDLVDPAPVAVYEVTTDLVDDTLLMVRFRAPAPECFAVQGEAIESDTVDEVLIRIVGSAIDGADCESDDPTDTGNGELGELVDQELALNLDNPIRGRNINTDLDGFDDQAPGSALDPGPSAPFSEYVSLPVAEAEALANANGVTFRITRQDSEEFGVTADYDEARVNFEVDDGIVSLAFPG